MNKSWLPVVFFCFFLSFFGHSQTWTNITNDPVGDGANPTLVDGTQLEYWYDSAADSIWFRITCSGISNTQAQNIGFNVMVNYPGGGSTFNFWGWDNTAPYHRLITGWISGTPPSAYTGVIGVANATGVNGGNFTNLVSNNLDINVNTTNNTMVIGLPRTDVIPNSALGVPILTAAAVGSNTAWNDDIYAVSGSMTLTTGPAPTADFSASQTMICEGDCINFTDLSTVGSNPAWSWTFNGATTTSSSVQNPTGICYNAAGTYDVNLVVTDANGNDTEIKTGYITVNAAPNPGTNASENLCNDNTLNLNTVLTGQDPGGTWVETSGTPSGQFTSGTGILNGNGLPIGNVYTFDYTVTGVAPCVDATATVTITIIDCTNGSPPTAQFSASQTVICEGECISFTDLSTVGNNPSWSWTFAGASTTTSNNQNPTSICYPTAGSYQVELTVTNDIGSDTETKVSYITVNPNPNVTATVSPNDTICSGDQVTLIGAGATSYTWNNGVNDNVPFTPAVGSTTYTVTGTDSNGCQGTNAVNVVVENCNPLVADWGVASSTICQGSCITFTDLTVGIITSKEWTFGTGASPTTSNQSDPTICFDSTGVIPVSLQVTNGTDTSVLTGSITVVAPPNVMAGDDTLIDLGGDAYLWAIGSGTGSYNWSPNEFVACDNCANTTAGPLLNTLYIVTFTDDNGCSASDSVNVQVNFIEGIGVPSAFSPNQDGNNDILFVDGLGIESMKFSIYNRYGERVFQTDNQGIGWDGTYQGRAVNSGVFVWMLEYRLINGATGILKGNTTLIR